MTQNDSDRLPYRKSARLFGPDSCRTKYAFTPDSKHIRPLENVSFSKDICFRRADSFQRGDSKWDNVSKHLHLPFVENSPLCFRLTDVTYGLHGLIFEEFFGALYLPNQSFTDDSFCRHMGWLGYLRWTDHSRIYIRSVIAQGIQNSCQNFSAVILVSFWDLEGVFLKGSWSYCLLSRWWNP